MNNTLDKIKDRRTEGCLYCGSLGLYSDEHVVPAGMGGDAPSWLLVDCVCRTCNTEIFSPLEAELLRRSPVALARLFSQDGTRDRDTPPTFHARTTLVHDSVSNLLLAAEPGERGAFHVLPQILCFTDAEGTKVSSTAQTHDALSQFLKKVSVILRDEVSLVAKQGPRSFQVSQLHWENDGYVPSPPTRVSKPPRDCVWLEPLDRPATADQGTVLPRCLYQKPQGQVVCRAAGADEACKVLLLVRHHFQDFLGSMNAPVAQGNQPTVHIGMATNMKKADQALVKTGLNILAFCVSSLVMRDEAFDEAVKFVLEGEPGSGGSGLVDGNVLGPALPGRHVLVLQQEGDGSVCFFAKLYGGSIQVFELGKLGFRPSALSDPIVLHVDYNAHLIQRMTLEDHAVSVSEVQVLGGFTDGSIPVDAPTG